MPLLPPHNHESAVARARRGAQSLAATLAAAVLLSCLLPVCTSCQQAEPCAMAEEDPTKPAKGVEPQEHHENRLALEKSPYLLQHADNPVDWYPWGTEAFERAAKLDKPIFLSIGYSTCHWCHVMERESFEDDEVAKLLNDAFVCIKVDREERPDVDDVYMTVCQMMTGSGGWPLTIVMTPDKKPFFAATYIPKRARFGRMGLLELVPRLTNVWKTRRKDVERSANQVAAALGRATAHEPGSDLDKGTLELAYRMLRGRFDEAQGGFGSAPKFPTPHNLLFLLRHWKRADSAKALDMVERTLLAMRRGGIFDHVGFGFHRYSTDRHWLVPHFEKMLYDQALLTLAYLEAFQATANPLYARTARETLTYVLRDMTDPAGGFYSAEDADSEGEEGKFYLWSHQQVADALGDEGAAALVRTAFAIRKEGNYPAHPGGPAPGGNIPHLAKPLGELAEELKLSEPELRKRLEAARQKLFDVRKRRVPPAKDDKVLTDWNGLMIAALARAAQVFDDRGYARAATRAADLILDKLRTPDGRLLHRYRDGHAGLPAHADDYAFLIWGLLELYEATFDVRHLQTAIALTDTMLTHHWDERGGGLFFTADDGEKLLVRNKEIYDGAIPSANSVAMLDLLRLGRITGRTELEERAAAIARAFSRQVARGPLGHTQLLVALDFALGPAHEITIAGPAQGADTKAMLAALRARFLPNKILLLRPTDTDAPEITRVAPFTRDQLGIGGKATAYVCLNYACERPQTDVAGMLASLKPVKTRQEPVPAQKP